MEIIDLLEKEQKYQYIMAHLIAINAGNVYHYDQMKESLGISDFMVNRYATDLNTQWEELFGYPVIMIVNRSIVHYETINSKNLKRFKQKLVLESLGYKMLLRLFHDELDITAFAEENFVSQSKVYDIRKLVSAVLEPYQLQIRKDHLLGSESKIRNLMMEVYSEVASEQGFDQEATVGYNVKEVRNLLVSNYTLSLSPSQQRKLTLFLFIQAIRVEKELFVERRVTMVKQENDVALHFLLIKHFIFPEEEFENELEYLWSFLYAHGFLLDRSFEGNHLEQDWERLSGRFLESFQQNVMIPAKLQDNISDINRECDRIHFRIQLFRVATNTFISDEQFAFFEEFYLTYHQFVLDFIQEEPMLKLLLPTRAEQVKLYYDYMFLLIKDVPISEIDPTIYICVDFSHGRFYTEYIAEAVRKFKDINITIEYKITSHTDIYISDYEHPKLTKEQIIWKNPPDSLDWAYFGDLVVAVRRKKNEQMVYQSRS